MSIQEEKNQLSNLFHSNVAKTLNHADVQSELNDKFPLNKNKNKLRQGEVKKSKKSKTSQPRITLRLTEEEHTQLKHLSEGMAVSAYIRKCIFGNKAVRRKRRSHAPVQDQQSMAKALALLGQSRIANNLNQLAHRANMESLIMDETTLVQINEAYDYVIVMRDALIRAMGLIEHT